MTARSGGLCSLAALPSGGVAVLWIAAHVMPGAVGARRVRHPRQRSRQTARRVGVAIDRVGGDYRGACAEGIKPRPDAPQHDRRNAMQRMARCGAEPREEIDNGADGA